jgi:hypothetical protein
MSFPNLPSAYQRLMIPLTETIISRVTSLPTSGNTIGRIDTSFPPPPPQLDTNIIQQQETNNKEEIKND